MNDEKEINRKGDDSLDGNARYHQLLQMVLFEGKYTFSTLCEVAVSTKSFDSKNPSSTATFGNNICQLYQQ